MRKSNVYCLLLWILSFKGPRLMVSTLTPLSLTFFGAFLQIALRYTLLAYFLAASNEDMQNNYTVVVT